MLAIKDLNNIIRFGKPVPVILNRTAGLDTCAVRVITQSLEDKTSKCL